ncbi:response regulator [Roseovarius aestuarii]|uniref:Response regulator rcp1 n=1 Tax=Roseovarius aestuarii TaxID=475083 RepID=A0A1X7BSN4_9RHOB|nr:response regulator [Roseovarius aestuarii]SMC12651.1 Response regulator rcp1 [Roseovarius aestuarii]
MIDAAKNRVILIVEDNIDDFEAVESAILNTGNFAGLIKRCASGQEALDILTAAGTGPHSAAAQQPSLIILDLNLPGLTGLEVLERIKSDGRLQMTPVVVMTSSTDQRDINACYRAGANAYLQKPMELDRLFSSVSRLTAFWLDTAILAV